ncbi:MAG: multidrug transporter subunit MdtC [Candidatus Puniceispirillum sp.]|nr:multidrug transporter subunit MdtC [Candidatus Puniceispirillum sp.]
MNLSKIFILRPVATTLLSVALALAGFLAYHKLPVAPLPQIDFPTVLVQASLPGASPEIMATSVATPLERHIGRVAGVNEMTSSSSLGSTRIVIQFDLSRNTDGAARDVQAAIDAATADLPSNLPSRPTYRKVNPADAPVIILSVSSEHHTVPDMFDKASTILQQKLSQVVGVGNVVVGGGSLPGVRVEVDPQALTKNKLNLEDLRAFLSSTNVTRPKGELTQGANRVTLFTNDQLFKAKEYKDLIISYKDSAAVRLKDVADVVDSMEDLRVAGISNNKPCVMLVIFRQPGANILTTVDNVRKALPSLQASVPASMQIQEVMNRTSTIRASLKEVEHTLLIATVLVVLVMFFFLQSARAALISSIVIPLCLLGTFALMYLSGFSLNNFSLMALTIATGFVVDDAVVVVENISRHIESGMRPVKAALLGAREIGFTVLSMSVSLMAVFIPIIFMGGLVGRFFKEFALTLCGAIFLSLLLSLSLTPMMGSKLLKRPKAKGGSLIERVRERIYRPALSWAIAHRYTIFSINILAVVATVLLASYIPKGLFPEQDTDRIICSVQGRQDISFQALKRALVQYVHILTQDKDVRYASGFIGGSNNVPNAGTIYMTLIPKTQRKDTMGQVMERLRKKLSQVQGANIFMRSAQDVAVGGRQTGGLYQYALTSPSLSVLHQWVPQLMTRMSKIPGVVDVNSDLQDHGLEVYVNVNKDKASTYGLTMEAIDQVLYDAFGQRQVSTLYNTRNQYHVVMEVAPAFWQRPESLNEVYVRAPSGEDVPLASFATFEPRRTLLSVNHQSMMPCATLSFNLLPGYALSQVTGSIEEAFKDLHVDKKDLMGAFQSTAKVFQDSSSGEFYLIIAAILSIYIVLGILYESLIHPLTILSTLPSAGVGALLALLITRTDLSLMGLIGVILLMGIVKKNAIMMIDLAIVKHRNEGKTAQEAILEACLLRFRPIMMTTFAAMLGALPLALGHGVGFEFRQPLGISIIGGLFVSQLLTLFTTPITYLILESLASRVTQRAQHS